jgi:hypothetical protein
VVHSVDGNLLRCGCYSAWKIAVLIHLQR